VLRGVELGHVDVDEPDVGIPEGRLRRRREVAVARADADDDVGVGRDAIRGERAGRADGAETRRIVVRKRSLPRLRLADRNPRPLAERAQRIGRLGVDDAAAGDDERPAGAADRVACCGEGGGTSNASAWTSCGNASVTAPVSDGLVSVRIAASAAGMTCSGRSIRSKYRDTGMKQSLTETSPRPGTSSCCRTGSGRRDAKTSPGSSRTGRRFTVASAAPVTMFVAPGPIELVHTNAPNRFSCRA
jgi:hypothetical protein